MTKYTPTVTKSQCYEIAKYAMKCQSFGDMATMLRMVASTIPSDKRNGWKYHLLKAANCFDSGKPSSSIFAKNGNTKLRFVAFSTLPIVTCPGAGACGGIANIGEQPDLKKAYCYSLKAWRYPAAFIRQLSNTLLLRFARDTILSEFNALPKNIVLRLYVDGDFSSVEVSQFWFDALRGRPDIKCYGYSKSWRILAKIDTIPGNYVLNLSSGGIDDRDDVLRNYLKSREFVRGEFVAIVTKLSHGKGAAKYSDPEYHRDVRQSAIDAGVGRVFSCPGRCFSCLGNGRHACGATDDNGKPLVSIPIAIGIH
jgi:hypothetical protein